MSKSTQIMDEIAPLKYESYSNFINRVPREELSRNIRDLNLKLFSSNNFKFFKWNQSLLSPQHGIKADYIKDIFKELRKEMNKNYKKISLKTKLWEHHNSRSLFILTEEVMQVIRDKDRQTHSVPSASHLLADLVEQSTVHNKGIVLDIAHELGALSRRPKRTTQPGAWLLVLLDALGQHKDAHDVNNKKINLSPASLTLDLMPNGTKMIYPHPYMMGVHIDESFGMSLELLQKKFSSHRGWADDHDIRWRISLGAGPDIHSLTGRSATAAFSQAIISLLETDG